MFIGFLPLGISFNSTEAACDSGYDFQTQRQHMLQPVSSDGLASGMAALEFLKICRAILPNRTERDECQETSEQRSLPGNLLLGPLVFSAIGYLAIAMVVQVSRWTSLSINDQDTVPQQVLCFKALENPIIELFPPRVMEIPVVETSDLWHRSFDLKYTRPVEFPSSKGGFFGPPGGHLEFFDPVGIGSQGPIRRHHKSLFSNENWY
jgi:hypothetical protein